MFDYQSWMILEGTILPEMPQCGCQRSLYTKERWCDTASLRPKGLTVLKTTTREWALSQQDKLTITSPYEKEEEKHIIRNIYFLIVQLLFRPLVSTSPKIFGPSFDLLSIRTSSISTAQYMLLFLFFNSCLSKESSVTPASWCCNNLLLLHTAYLYINCFFFNSFQSEATLWCMVREWAEFQHRPRSSWEPW